MDLEDEMSHYVVQTLSDNDEDNKMLLESNTIVICSEDGEQTQYVPFAVDNGQIILKKLEDESPKRLEDENCVKIIENTENKSNNDFVTKLQLENTNRRFRRSDNLHQRRKMSYETEFKPCNLPPNKGGLKGLIRYGRKHLIIDQQIMISPREFKAQLNDSEDLIMKSELAPCTKQQMRHMLTGITRLFAYPAHNMPNNKLLQLYVGNCTSRKQPNYENMTDMKLLPVGYKIEVDPTKIKRITRKRRYPEAEEYLRKQSLLQQAETSEPNDDIQQLLDAANTASTDHGYTNKIETIETVEEENIDSIKIDDSDQIYIMQSVDDNGTQSSIEVLLAAAAETSDEDEKYQQLGEEDDTYQRIFYIVQNEDGQIMCQQNESDICQENDVEYILP